MIAIDQVEVENRGLAAAMVRGGMESLVGSTLGVGAARCITAGLERDDTRHVRLKCQHLEVEHQLHVLGE